MKRVPVQLALVVLLLAFLGAVLHPLSLALSLAPFNSHGLINFLQSVREGIADLLGWGILAALATMVVYIAYERWINRVGQHSMVGNLSEQHPLARPRPSHGVVVAITAYNDAEATAQAARDFAMQPGVVKVLVIDNNSTDRTPELARAAGATVISEPKQGYGFTCIRGLTEALTYPEADVIVLTEGDGTFLADDLRKFLAYIDHAELVVGNRVVRGLVARDSQMDSFFTWGNMAVAMLLRLRFWDGRHLGPAGLSDVGCTFRAIRRDALKRILPDLNVGGNHFSAHMLLVALAHGLSVVEIPVRFRRRIGESKGASRSFWKGLDVGITMIWHILTFTPKRGESTGIIVERDGLIIRHVNGDARGQPRIEFVPDAPDLLAAISRRGQTVVVIGDGVRSRPSSVSRRMSRGIDARIAAAVEDRGGHVDAFVDCPHGPGQPCSCRYPKPNLLVKAAKQSSLRLSKAVVVSDRPNFLLAAAELGCRTILVQGGNYEPFAEIPVERVADLRGAFELVVGNTSQVETFTNGHSNSAAQPVAASSDPVHPST